MSQIDLEHGPVYYEAGKRVDAQLDELRALRAELEAVVTAVDGLLGSALFAVTRDRAA